MRICVFGAGAIGGYLAVELALSGQDVCVVARGAHLDAIRSRGLTLRIRGETRIARLPASADPHDLGPQDLVICSLKAHQAYAAAGEFAPLLRSDTAVLAAVNGVPWWYFHRSGGRFEGRHLDAVDPGGRLWRALGPERAIGCVVEPACEAIAPGVIAHHDFTRFTLGEPDGSRSSRIEALARALNGAGLDAPIRADIRWNIWVKLWGNVCFNPISVLTGATLDRIVGDAPLLDLCKAMMLETRAVNESLGVRIPPEMMQRRLAAAGKLASHKMSMLQDLERGRKLEIDALVTAVQELARLTGVATPAIDTVLALVRARGRAAGLYEPLAVAT